MGLKFFGFFKRHYILTGFFVFIIAVVGWWRYEFPSFTWHYKMTVTIETPNGFKTGYAVKEITNSDSTLLGMRLPEMSVRMSSVRGEAVAIDLGKYGIVFTVIGGSYVDELYRAFSVQDESNSIHDFGKLKSGKSMQLPQKDWPVFVTFKDINDPKSVELVYQTKKIFVPHKMADDYQITDNFKKLFGEGVKITDVTIEVTDEPMTHQIGKWLKWLDTLETTKTRLNGSTSVGISTNELSDNLAAGSFRVK